MSVRLDASESFSGYSMERELTMASEAAEAAVALCADRARARAVLHDALTAEAACSPSGEWVWHADSHDVTIALIGAEGAVLSLHRGLARPEITLFAISEEGTYARRNGEDVACVAGFASERANVVHLPASEMLCPGALGTAFGRASEAA